MNKHELTKEKAQQLRLFFLVYNVLVAWQLFTVSFSPWIYIPARRFACAPVFSPSLASYLNFNESTWFYLVHDVSSHLPVLAATGHIVSSRPAPLVVLEIDGEPAHISLFFLWPLSGSVSECLTA